MKVKSKKSKVKRFIGLLIGLLGLVVLACSAQAATLYPASSVVNPVSGALYAVNNAATRIDVYKASGSWTNTGIAPIALPAGSQCYGLAVSADGTKLYISISAGSASKTRIYSLDSNGLPTYLGDMAKPDGTAVYWPTDSAPSGLALGGDNKLFVTDMGTSWFRIFDTASNTWLKNTNVTDPSTGQPVNNLYSVAVTPGTASYKIYVSRKADPGAVYVYNYSSGTVTFNKAITGLTNPTYLKVVGGKLFVAVNGTDGVDIKVYNTADDSLVGNVMSGTAGMYGWNSFDVSSDGTWLVYKKAADSGEVNNYLYKIMISGISGNVVATKITHIDNILNPPNPGNVIASDGLAISVDRASIGLSDSSSGNFEQVYSNIVDQRPNAPASLQQFKLDGVTPIAKGGSTTENQIICKFTVSDPDGNTIIPSVLYGPVGGVGTRVTGATVASGSTVSITIPASGGLAAGAYEWSARADDGQGMTTDYAYGNDTGTADFVISIPTPTLTGITPNSGAQNTMVSITNLSGTNFVANTAVKLTRAGQSDITATGLTVVSPTQITCSFNLANAQIGAWNVVATNPDGQTAVLTNGFSVTAPAPLLTNVSPTSGTQGTSLTLSLTGLNFASGAAVKLTRSGQPDIAATGVTVSGSTQISATLTIPSTAQTGAWSVVETNPDGQTTTLTNIFTVNAVLAAPTVNGLTPNTGAQGATVNITNLAGTNFASGATVKLIKSGQPDIAATSVAVVSSTKITCTIVIPSSAQAGYWGAVVTNPDGQSGTLAGAAFTITTPPPAPTVSSITVNSATQGATATISNLAGANFVSGATVKLVNGSNTINMVNASVMSSTKITGSFNIPLAAPAGAWNVVVTNPDSQTGILTSGFTVNAAPSALTVTAIAPNSTNEGFTINITNLAGTNFASGATVKLTSGANTINMTNPVVASATQITGSFVIPLTAPTGAWDITVNNLDGGTATLTGGFTVNQKLPAPTVISIDPNNGVAGGNVTIVNLIGTNFLGGATVQLTNGASTINATNVTVASAAYITCKVAIPSSAAVGKWNVIVTNPDTQSASLPNGFTVYAPGTAPTITSIAPATGAVNTTVTITNLAGTNFAAGATAKLAMTGQADIPMTGLTVVSPTQISGSFVIPASAQTGTWTVIVTNTDNQTGQLVDSFNVTSTSTAPTIASIDPNNGVQGNTVTAVNVIGSNFVTGETVKLTKTGQTDITAEAAYYSSTYLSCTIPIPAGAAVGAWNVVVGNPAPDTQTATLENGFTVYAPGANSPTIASITPAKGQVGTSVTASVVGTNFASGATVYLAKTGQANIPMNMTGATITPTNISGSFAIPQAAQTGPWTVIVTNTATDKQTAELVDGFNVTTEANPSGAISNITIARDADTVGSSVTVSWQTNPANAAVDVYTLTGTFTTDAAAWTTKASTNNMANKFTDANQVGNGTAKYYKVVATGATLATTDLTQEVVGKFDIKLNVGFNLISVPLVNASGNPNIGGVIGNQLTAGAVPPLADKVYQFKADQSGYTQAWLNSADNKWYDADTQTVSTMTVSNDAGYWVEIASANPVKNVTVVGLISETNRGPIAINNSFNLIGNGFPVAVNLANSGLKEGGATAGAVPPLACKIYQFKDDQSGYTQAWLNSADNKWYDADTQTVSTMQLIPGKAYWIEQAGNNFSWNYPKPY